MDGDGIENDCDPEYTGATDCDGNGVIDACDLDEGLYEDCNTNGVPDLCDINDGTSVVLDLDGIPDECDCVGDANGDLFVSIADNLFVLSQYGPCSGCLGDLNEDNEVGF